MKLVETLDNAVHFILMNFNLSIKFIGLHPKLIENARLNPRFIRFHDGADLSIYRSRGRESWGTTTIDCELAIQWANDAGFETFCMPAMQTDEIQTLINRAMNEAFEGAAHKVQSNNTAMTDMLAAEIRALKVQP